MSPTDPSLRHLLARVALVHQSLAGEARQRRGTDPRPDDPFRGLQVDAQQLAAVLARGRSHLGPRPAAVAAVEEAARRAEEGGASVRLRSLARRLGLDDDDTTLLLVALLPDVEPASATVVAYLHDDVTRRRPSVGLALSVIGAAPWDHRARARLAPGAALVDAGLVDVGDAHQPFLERTLACPERVTAHLLGGDRPDPAVAPLLVDPPAVEMAGAAPLAAAMHAGDGLAHLVDNPSGTARALGCLAVAALGSEPLAADLARLPGERRAEAIRALVRDARLGGRGLVVGPLDCLRPEESVLIDVLARSGVPTVLHGPTAWDPAWTSAVPISVAAPAAGEEDRRRWWSRSLASTEIDAASAPVHLRLGPDAVDAAATAARLHAAHRGEALSAAHLHDGARAQNGVALDRLARRITPSARWADLVLPEPAEAALRTLVSRARHLDLVLDEWGMGRPSRGRGLSALFAGESGTGKTLAAEVVAGALGLDLYTINLATVVDKYIGETEKNLERLFEAAADVNGVLFFDEADALFGKRSEVSDARDRYANVEVAYLLQRIEAYDGIAVLATNLRGNVDEAFTRRISVIVEFPPPDAARRQAIWRAALGDRVPLADDVDLAALASRFDLRGGDIASSAAAAAFLAADNGQVVDQEHLVTAAQHEYRKLGRLLPR